MKRITIKDKVFRPFISTPDIENATRNIASKLNDKYHNEIEPVVFLVILNGAVPFAGELLTKLKFPTLFDTIEISPYDGKGERDRINLDKNPSIDLNKKKVIVVKDVIDSGETMDFLQMYLETRGVSEVSIVSLLFKPNSYKKNHPDFTHWGMLGEDLPQKYKNLFVGMLISDSFVVGYGMDYEGMGRNLNKIYVLENTEEKQ